MNRRQLVMAALLVLGLSSLFPEPAAAYIGPGVGMSAIGTFLAIIAGLFIAILGFLWYPIKRLLRKRKKKEDSSAEQTDTDDTDGNGGASQ